jgi:hypothetical protein
MELAKSKNNIFIVFTHQDSCKIPIFSKEHDRINFRNFDLSLLFGYVFYIIFWNLMSSIQI